MQGWLDPIGPEPAGTYWIRRGIIAAVLVALLAVATWSWTLPSDKDVTIALGQSPSPSASAPASPGPTTPAPTAIETSPTSSEANPSAPASEPSPSVPETPPAPVVCRPQSLTLEMTGPAEASNGTPVAFTVAVVTSQAACVLDLAAVDANVVVTSGSDRIWGASDCPDWKPAGTLELAQGQGAGFEVSWPVQRSNGCELSPARLGAGTYVATVTVGSARARHVMQVLP